jgi:hypothetical protein
VSKTKWIDKYLFKTLSFVLKRIKKTVRENCTRLLVFLRCGAIKIMCDTLEGGVGKVSPKITRRREGSVSRDGI